jgi:hypothetical protein
MTMRLPTPCLKQMTCADIEAHAEIGGQAAEGCDRDEGE